LQACWAEFTLRPPHAKSGEHRKEGVRVGAIRVWEVDPPTGAALEAAIGITAILALGLLMLRDVARDETPVEAGGNACW